MRKDAAALSSQKAESATLNGEHSVQGLVIPFVFSLIPLDKNLVSFRNPLWI